MKDNKVETKKEEQKAEANENKENNEENNNNDPAKNEENQEEKKEEIEQKDENKEQKSQSFNSETKYEKIYSEEKIKELIESPKEKRKEIIIQLYSDFFKNKGEKMKSNQLNAIFNFHFQNIEFIFKKGYNEPVKYITINEYEDKNIVPYIKSTKQHFEVKLKEFILFISSALVSKL